MVLKILLFVSLVNISLVYCNNYGSLTFVVQEHLDVEQEIQNLRNHADEVSHAIWENPSRRISETILMSVTSPFDTYVHAKTSDKDEFKNALDAMEIEPQKRCPKLSLSGIEKGLKISKSNSYLFVFTDGSVKGRRNEMDQDLNNTLDLARSRGSQVFTFITPSYCPGRQNTEQYFYDLASATNGLVLRLDSVSDTTSAIMDFIKLVISGEVTTNQRQIIPENTEETVQIDFDSQTNYVVLVASGTNVNIGNIATPGVIVERNYDLKHVQWIKVKAPAPGKYSVSVKGESKTTVMVFSRNEFTFQYYFTEEQDYLSSRGVIQPWSGKYYFLVIDINDPHQAVMVQKVEIVSPDETQVFKMLNLTYIGGNLYATKMFQPPSQTQFLMRLTGKDNSNGKQITRRSKVPITSYTEKPHIVRESDVTNMTVLVNQVVKLHCPIDKGVPEPVRTWFVYYFAGDGFFRQLNVTDETLVVVPKKVATNVVYLCRAQNSVSEEQITIRLNVESAPDFKSDIKTKYTAIEGETLTIDCNATGSPKPYMSWSVGTKELGPDAVSDDPKVYALENGSLVIRQSEIKHTNHYTCTAKNNHGTTRHVFQVVIGQPPHITTDFDVTTVFYGNDTFIKCNIEKGIPEPEVSWYFANNKEPNNFVSLHYIGNELNVESANYTDAGFYKCLAINVFGNDSKIVELIVEGPPVILSDDTKEYTALEGDVTLRIPCVVAGNPTPTVYWRSNGTLTIGGKYEISADELIINDPKKDDSKNYTCIASNKYGSTSKTFTAVITKHIDDDNEDQTGNFTYKDVKTGDTLSLECAGRWYREWEQMNVTGKLTVKITGEQEVGNYTCRTSNKSASISHTYIVLLGYAPVFKNDATNEGLVMWNPKDISQNQKEFLKCWVDMEPSSRTASVEWWYNGHPSEYQIKYDESYNQHPINDIGNYTCTVKNTHGSVTRTFNVHSEGCIIKIKSTEATAPMVMDTSKTWPTFELKAASVINVEPNQKLLFTCPRETYEQNSFENMPGANILEATCEKEYGFTILNKHFELSELKCNQKVMPIYKTTSRTCGSENTELVEIGYDIESFPKFMSVYSICYDKVNNVPLYFDVNKARAQYTRIESEWLEYEEYPDEGMVESCEEEGCCLRRGRLDTELDTRRGPRQGWAETAVRSLHAVPYWSKGCHSDGTWTDLENILQYRRFGVDRILSGAHDYTYDANNNVFVPRYLSKVLFYPSGTIAFINVNDLYPHPNDIRCRAECPSYVNSTQYTYCCSLEEYKQAFNVPDFD